MKFVSKYLWIICVFAGLFTLAGSLKATLPQPVIGTWNSTNSLTQARANAASVLLPDGRILIAGGESGGGPLQSAEIFGTNGIVSSATSMNVARSHHFAVALVPIKAGPAWWLIRHSLILRFARGCDHAPD